MGIPDSNFVEAVVVGVVVGIITDIVLPWAVEYVKRFWRGPRGPARRLRE